MPRTETLTRAQAREHHGVLPPAEEHARFRAHIAVKAAAKPGRSGPDEMTLRESAFGESEAVLGQVG